MGTSRTLRSHSRLKLESNATKRRNGNSETKAAVCAKVETANVKIEVDNHEANNKRMSKDKKVVNGEVHTKSEADIDAPSFDPIHLVVRNDYVGIYEELDCPNILKRLTVIVGAYRCLQDASRAVLRTREEFFDYGQRFDRGVLDNDPERRGGRKKKTATRFDEDGRCEWGWSLDSGSPIKCWIQTMRLHEPGSEPEVIPK